MSILSVSAASAEAEQSESARTAVNERRTAYILRSDEHVPDAGPGQFMSVAHVARPQGISCNLKPFA